MTSPASDDVTESLDYVINIDSSAFTRALGTGNRGTLICAFPGVNAIAYIGQNDVTKSTATIRSPFCGYNMT